MADAARALLPRTHLATVAATSKAGIKLGPPGSQPLMIVGPGRYDPQPMQRDMMPTQFELYPRSISSEGDPSASPEKRDLGGPSWGPATVLPTSARSGSMSGSKSPQEAERKSQSQRTRVKTGNNKHITDVKRNPTC